MKVCTNPPPRVIDTGFRSITISLFLLLLPLFTFFKGRVEAALVSVASESNEKMVAYIFRPGTVISRTTVTSLGGLASTVASAGLRILPSVVTNVERVARVLVDASVGIRVEWQRQGPNGEKDTWESEEIVSWSLGLGV